MRKIIHVVFLRNCHASPSLFLSCSFIVIFLPCHSWLVFGGAFLSSFPLTSHLFLLASYALPLSTCFSFITSYAFRLTSDLFRLTLYLRFTSRFLLISSCVFRLRLIFYCYLLLSVGPSYILLLFSLLPPYKRSHTRKHRQETCERPQS